MLALQCAFMSIVQILCLVNYHSISLPFEMLCYRQTSVHRMSCNDRIENGRSEKCSVMASLFFTKTIRLACAASTTPRIRPTILVHETFQAETFVYLQRYGLNAVKRDRFPALVYNDRTSVTLAHMLILILMLHPPHSITLSVPLRQ